LTGEIYQIDALSWLWSIQVPLGARSLGEGGYCINRDVRALEREVSADYFDWSGQWADLPVDGGRLQRSMSICLFSTTTLGRELPEDPSFHLH
jgi:hypothetical protein